MLKAIMSETKEDVTEPVQVLLVATGENRKLQPVTNLVPPPLVPVANRPLLLYPLELLARQNQKQILVALHNQAGHIESYLGKGERWGVKLDYLLQRKALGNGGSVKQAASRVGDNLLLVVPSDTVIDFDVAELIAFHRAHGACLTALVSSHGSEACEEMQVAASGQVILAGDGAGNGRSTFDTGLYLLSPEVIAHIPAGKHIDIHGHLIPDLIEKGLPVYAYESQSYWNPLHSFAAYQEFQAVLLKNGSGGDAESGTKPLLQPYWQRSRKMADGIWIGRNNVIHPDVRLQPPVVIGDNCYIGAGAQLGPAAVIGNNVVIAEEATIRETAVFNGTYVGQLVNLKTAW
ncbi:MAG: NDP-sugar synthase [Chloroflexota bacterium]